MNLSFSNFSLFRPNLALLPEIFFTGKPWKYLRLGMAKLTLETGINLSPITAFPTTIASRVVLLPKVVLDNKH